ncbi:MAG TPA: ATP-binding protein [Ramlibacter sp.]|nr:ATP-binding protein [Ramlibacter sp.]
MTVAVSSRLSPAAVLAALALVYFASAAGSMQAFGQISPIWYSNAIAIFALLYQPARNWPALLAAAYLADAAAIALAGQGPPLLVAVADLLEIVLAAAALRAIGCPRRPIFEGAQIFRVLPVCVLAPVAGATVGSAVLAWFEDVALLETWHTWHSASALGLVIALPLLLSWADPKLRQRALRRLDRPGWLWLGAGVLVAAALVDATGHPSLLFLTFPVLFALTWTFGLLGATAGVLAVTIAGFWATLAGQGALVSMVLPVTSEPERIEALQIYLATMLLSNLPLALLRAQQQELAEQLRRTGEARAEFLAAMSHEIRTPMTGVLGMADLLAAEELTPQQQHYVEGMRASGRHLLSIINDILDFSRIESGRLELEDIDFALPEVLERLRSLVHPLAVERGLALEIVLSPHSPQTLRGDPLRIRQVLLNLVSNAIKFTDRGRVVVSVAAQRTVEGPGARVRFEVRDTGVGIAPDKLAQLFTPFMQADRSISRQYGGSGLGLAISKRLIEAMGGTIAATSTPGAGSVFFFEIPLVEGDPLQAQPSDARQRIVVRPRRILVAEDVEINREILRTTLARQGHLLRFAVDGVEALALAQQHDFDVILMDVQMPVMDGVEATRRIRRLPAPKGSVPILGLTANVMARERERYLHAGMNDCLPKPIDWDRLAAALAAHGGEDVPPLPPPMALPSTDSEPLLDQAALDGLARMADAQELKTLIRVGMEGYDAACDRMAAAGATPQQIRNEAHKLRGSSGTLGLARVCAVATRIEQEAPAGRRERVQELVAALRAAITATRGELARRGLLARPTERADYST